ncbi:hypothetical protein NBRC111894_4680 [Sporolactobacillus inulinus]|uniref:Uncharacterized protein n=1 Tax=Sporolactobacillus inulinus TaxID=2078 RepID=A0A4Y1ZIU5_9BACL|nr:DUF6773 family protein [Sporolactobacillus inulinus]GAY79126.1 hypothetical protein NBRC111894_4680 [Sporolactobacillus inulinus]
MRINDVKDERIMMESNNIISAVSGILVLGIVGDIFFKIYSNKPIQSYLFEVIVLIIAGIFYLIEATRKGVLELINNQKEKRKIENKVCIDKYSFSIIFRRSRFVFWASQIEY